MYKSRCHNMTENNTFKDGNQGGYRICDKGGGDQ